MRFGKKEKVLTRNFATLYTIYRLTRSSAIVPDIQRAYFECAVCKGAEEVDIVNGRIAEPSKVDLHARASIPSLASPAPPFAHWHLIIAPA